MGKPNTVKVKPATALPWKTRADNVVSWQDPDTVVCDCMGSLKQRMENSTYIAHAANSYPNLVEALRDHVNVLTSLDARRKRAFPRQITEHAEALLRELGEES